MSISIIHLCKSVEIMSCYVLLYEIIWIYPSIANITSICNVGLSEPKRRPERGTDLRFLQTHIPKKLNMLNWVTSITDYYNVLLWSPFHGIHDYHPLPTTQCHSKVCKSRPVAPQAHRLSLAAATVERQHPPKQTRRTREWTRRGTLCDPTTSWVLVLIFCHVQPSYGLHPILNMRTNFIC